MWRDQNTGKTYLIDNNSGKKKSVLGNGQIAKKYIPGVTGCSSARMRQQVFNINKKGMKSFGITMNNFLSPDKGFKGFSQFTKSAVKPSIKKCELFKMTGIAKPKGLMNTKFLSNKNNKMLRQLQMYKTSRAGTAFLTTRRSQSQVTYKLSKDNTNSKLIKSDMTSNSPTPIKAKRPVIGKAINLREAISKASEKVNGRMLNKPMSNTMNGFGNSKARNCFSRAENFRRSKMSLTSYGSNLKSPPRATTSHNMYTSQPMPNMSQLRVQTADSSKVIFTPLKGKRTVAKSTKFSPKKIKPFLQYSLQKLRVASKTSLKNPVEVAHSENPKTPVKISKKLKKDKEEVRGESPKNHDEEAILLEKLSESSSSSVQFNVNDLDQQEREANMFADPPKTRQKNRVRPRLIFDNATVKTTTGQFVCDKLWKACSNPEFHQQEKEYNKKDRILLEKRRTGRLLKNMALEAELEIVNKRIEKESKRMLYYNPYSH
ncbi:unnamed protein product [Moneuplotes crassus]|uniref:Uncharacterized protein n=1 Tax=Euplotes crassus TaxID=5936 RepID=A0AAD1UHU8_EUPCR|nr:unnamed protein product [Moneuplotes crassus]